MYNIKCEKMSHSPQTQQETGNGLEMNGPESGKFQRLMGNHQSIQEGVVSLGNRALFLQHTGAIDVMLSSQNSYVEILMPSVMVLGGGTFRR